MTAADTPSREEKMSLAIKAVEGWQRNRMTTFTPSNILQDFGDEILDALRLAAKPADDDVREEPEVIAARICERIWSKKYQTLRTMEKVSIAESEIVKAIKAERALSTKAPKP